MCVHVCVTRVLQEGVACFFFYILQAIMNIFIISLTHKSLLKIWRKGQHNLHNPCVPSLTSRKWCQEDLWAILSIGHSLKTRWGLTNVQWLHLVNCIHVCYLITGMVNRMLAIATHLQISLSNISIFQKIVLIQETVNKILSKCSQCTSGLNRIFFNLSIFILFTKSVKLVARNWDETKEQSHVKCWPLTVN